MARGHVERMAVSDTRPEAEQVLVALLRQAPTWRKLALMGQLNAMTKSMALNELRRHYPDASERALRRRLAERLLGAELAETVYGPLPPASESDEAWDVV